MKLTADIEFRPAVLRGEVCGKDVEQATALAWTMSDVHDAWGWVCRNCVAHDALRQGVTTGYHVTVTEAADGRSRTIVIKE
jgi:hypothetical protein